MNTFYGKKQKQFPLDTTRKLNLKFKAFLSRNKLEHKPFQAECFKWCAEKEQAEQQQAQVKGGILALEMGLGKTIIMIGTFVANPMLKTLIILPPVLIDQWVKQIFKTKQIIYKI